MRIRIGKGQNGRYSWLLGCLLAVGCPASPDKLEDTETEDTVDSAVLTVDADGDGYLEPQDCDDDNAEIHPGVVELCNGVDDNCNSVVDEGFSDVDQDGVSDCVDVEECDGVDNDGDGEVDEDFGDLDGDGVADCVDSEECDGIDNDGDGTVDEGYDADGDGYTLCGSDSVAADCDDFNSDIHPGAAEVDGNGIDDDCDSLLDEGVWSEGDLVVTEILVNPQAVVDRNGEWFEIYNVSGATRTLNGLEIVSGSDSHQVQSDEVLTLAAEAVMVLGNNGDSGVNGGVSLDYVYSDVQLSNEVDSLELKVGELVVDAVTWDDGLTMPDVSGASLFLDPWYFEAVANDDPASWCLGFESWALNSDLGSPGELNDYCPEFDRDLDGFNPNTGDCDEDDATVFPGATETWYDGVDQDCDGANDFDADADGHDSIDHGGDDCDDTNAAVNPVAAEVCDGVDNDCDGTIDGSASIDASTWYSDDDGDGYGGASSGVVDCTAPSNLVPDGQDCDDTDPAINPGATEDCNDAIDHDCDGFSGCSYCGDGVLDAGEEYEPPPGPFSNASVDSQTCRWDFSGVNQLYCNGSCSWAGGSGCDQSDADILCKLVTDNENSVATSWTNTTALAESGFPCTPLGYGTTISGLDRGVTVPVSWQDSSILGNHGAGSVIAYPVCTNP
ncbi:MAG: MopE-related protein [Myxococcota bacterium]|nr:MopE-related protein [Myxococcota bacterium]